jgi:hypothetical protein
MAGCCVTKIRANLQLVLDHHARKDHTGRRGKNSTTKPACSGHLQPRLPTYRCKSARTPQNQYGRCDEKMYPCLAGNRTTLNGSVIILTEISEPTTGCTIPESNSGGGEIFRTRPDRPRDPPSLCTMGTQSLPGVKRPRRGFLTISNADVKDRVQLHLYSSSKPSRPVLG